MGTRRGAIAKLPLMDTKDGMEPVLAQESQMGTGAEGAITHEDVPRTPRRMEGRHRSQVMGVPGSGERLQQEARAGMKQGEQMGHGEPAPRTLPAGLAKRLWEFWGRGHRDTRPIDQEGAVPPPSSLVMGCLLADGGRPPPQRLEDEER